MIGLQKSPIKTDLDLIFTYGFQNPKVTNTANVLPASDPNCGANAYGLSVNGLVNYRYAIVTIQYNRNLATDFSLECYQKQYGFNKATKAWFKNIFKTIGVGTDTINRTELQAAILVQSVNIVNPTLQKLTMVCDLTLVDGNYTDSIFVQLANTDTTDQIRDNIREITVYGTNDEAYNFFLT